NSDRPRDAAIALAIVDDAAAVLLACVMSTRLTGDGATAPPWGAVFFVLAVWMLLVGVGGLNTLEHLPLATMGRRIFTVTIIALNVFIAMSYLTRGWLPRPWVFHQVPIAAAAVLLVRWWLEFLLRHERRR